MIVVVRTSKTEAKKIAAAAPTAATRKEKTTCHYNIKESEISQENRIIALEFAAIAMLEEWQRDPEIEPYMEALTDLLQMRRQEKQKRGDFR